MTAGADSRTETMKTKQHKFQVVIIATLLTSRISLINDCWMYTLRWRLNMTIKQEDNQNDENKSEIPTRHFCGKHNQKNMKLFYVRIVFYSIFIRSDCNWSNNADI